MSPSLPEDTLTLFNEDSNTWFTLEGYERSFGSPLTFDATEVGLFNGNFVPPPPRPPFLDESAQFDGLTTCGMCSWATKNDLVQANNSTIDVPGEWSFPVLITIVSIISALVGAFVMVTFLKCRRIKAGNSSGGPIISWWPGGSDREVSGSSSISHGHRSSGLVKHGGDTIRVPHTSSSNNGVWTWLGQRRVSGGPDPLSQPSSSPAENHYTHMDDSYNAEPGEALYAELDRESIQSGNPSYQNTAYSGCEEADKELQVFSSAPSSAYYSDLSVTTNTLPTHTMHGERTYEIVGHNSQNRCPLLESPGLLHETNQDHVSEFGLNVLSARRHHRLSAINESSGGVGTTIGGGASGAGAGQLLHSDFV